MNKDIKKNDSYELSPLSLGDPIYSLHMTTDKVVRECNKEHLSFARKLCRSGLLQELYKRNLIPETTAKIPSEEDMPITIIQERITPLIYPFEWSPEMLRKAAACIVMVNQCANQFGYQLKDSHPYNVVFKYGTPLFVDIGSFIETTSKKFWSAHSQFDTAVLQTLRLAHNGCLSIFKRSFMLNGAGYEPYELFAIKHPMAARLLGIKILRFFFLCTSTYKIGPTIADDQIESYFKIKPLCQVAKFLLKSTWMPFRAFKPNRLLKQINSYKLQHHTTWGTYHEQSGYYKKDDTPSLSNRMLKVIDYVKELAPDTVIELAGNQGVLSRAMANKCPSVKSVLCSDYDLTAIDFLVKNLESHERVYPASFDFIAEVTDIVSKERAQRLKADLVIALAVVHHLVLTQSYKLEVIFKTLSAYTNNYIIIEFMPLGLWDGNSAPPLPEWYNEDWFISIMQNYFTIVKREQLEPNRIAFIGSKCKA